MLIKNLRPTSPINTRSNNDFHELKEDKPSEDSLEIDETIKGRDIKTNMKNKRPLIRITPKRIPTAIIIKITGAKVLIRDTISDIFLS